MYLQWSIVIVYTCVYLQCYIVIVYTCVYLQWYIVIVYTCVFAVLYCNSIYLCVFAVLYCNSIYLCVFAVVYCNSIYLCVFAVLYCNSIYLCVFAVVADVHSQRHNSGCSIYSEETGETECQICFRSSQHSQGHLKVILQYFSQFLTSPVCVVTSSLHFIGYFFRLTARDLL